jgi:osmoprotectant transport system substrate-binding protein
VSPRPGRGATTTEAGRAALAAALRRYGLRVLAASAAQDQNAVVTTRAVAARAGWRRVSDLRPAAGRLTIGGPPECPERSYCLIGLRDTYGLQFGHFLPLAGSSLVESALRDGTIDIGVMFTTDGALASGGLTVLVDDRGLQPPENVVPVVSDRVVERYGPRLTRALDDVSASLTTAALRFLNWHSTIAGNTPETEARAWLVRHGLRSVP